MKIQQNQKKSVKITCFTEDEKVYFFEPLEREISVEDMQKIVDANEKIIKELKNNECIKPV